MYVRADRVLNACYYPPGNKSKRLTAGLFVLMVTL